MSDHGAASQPTQPPETDKQNSKPEAAHPVSEAAQEEAGQDRAEGGGYT